VTGLTDITINGFETGSRNNRSAPYCKLLTGDNFLNKRDKTVQLTPVVIKPGASKRVTQCHVVLDNMTETGNRGLVEVSMDGDGIVRVYINDDGDDLSLGESHVSDTGTNGDFYAFNIYAFIQSA
jgi:hypothetical protein